MNTHLPSLLTIKAGRRMALSLLVFLLACSQKNSTEQTPKVDTNEIARAPQADDFAFAVFGDTRGGIMSVKPDCSGGVYTLALKRALDHIAKEGRAKTIIFTGDAVQGGTTAPCLKKQLADWKRVIAPYRQQGIEFLVTPGNHEIDDGTMIEFEPERLGKPTKGAIANQQAMIEAFPEMPKNGPLGGGFTYYLRKNSVLLIVLDAYRPGYFNTIDLSWLRSVLTGKPMVPPPQHIFVVTHVPAFPMGGHVQDSLPNFNLERRELAGKGIDPWPWQVGVGGPRDVDVDWRSKRDEFWKLLVEYKVTAFFAGHEHTLGAEQVDGVWQFISGGLTRDFHPANEIPLKLYDGQQQNPQARAIWHGGDKLAGYFLVTVRNGKAVAEVYGWPAQEEGVKLVKSFAL